MPFLLDSDGRRKLCVFADTGPGSSRYDRARGDGRGLGADAAERPPILHPAASFAWGASFALSSFALSK